MKITGNLIEANFIKRLNRFEAVVAVNGKEELVHVPNTGRLRELLTENALVVLKESTNPLRKTKYSLLLVLKDGIWVSIDSSNVPNLIVYEALQSRYFQQFDGFMDFRREVTYGSSRFDFALYSDTREYFIEVKGVTLVDGNTARFPDAPTTRGRRHLDELSELKAAGYGAGVIFIIQRNDADVFIPNDATDPDFANALRKAQKCGVDLWAYRCSIDKTEIAIEKEIPVRL